MVRIRTTTEIIGDCNCTVTTLHFLVSSDDDGYLLSQVAMGASHAVAPDGQVTYSRGFKMIMVAFTCKTTSSIF